MFFLHEGNFYSDDDRPNDISKTEDEKTLFHQWFLFAFPIHVFQTGIKVDMPWVYMNCDALEKIVCDFSDVQHHLSMSKQMSSVDFCENSGQLK